MKTYKIFLLELTYNCCSLNLITIIFLFLLLSSFTNNRGSYQIACATLDTHEYITLQIYDTKDGKGYQQQQAQKDAIHAILFSGIAINNGGSNQKPILYNQEEINKYKKIESEFFSKRGSWSKYSRLSTEMVTSCSPIDSKKWKVYTISVAKNLLRKDLQEQQILKPLNSGF
ncbi:hypothetical protein [Rufibacter sp. LB8]|uniref:hypothetical protein n=1 Tax=Rufibacter sp. LB8 TaxID=2777781 RepID=UPI00178C7439|nr:hypothetical protein [Rufibacter sp. LB8]